MLHSIRGGKTSGKSVNMFDFSDLFRVSKKKRFGVGKSFVEVLCTVCQKPRSNKSCIFPIPLSQKSNWRVSHVFFGSKDDSNHWNKKNEQADRSEKPFFRCSISIKLFEKLDFKNGDNNGVRSVQEEHTSFNSLVPPRCGVKIDRTQLMNSDNYAKHQKGVKERNAVFDLLNKFLIAYFQFWQVQFPSL